MKKVMAGLVSLAFALLLVGCAGDDSKQAFLKQAYTLGSSYTLVQKGAITYLKVAQPSQDVKDKINRADDVAAPLVKQVLECAKAMSAPPPPAPVEALELGLDAAQAQQAQCEGYLNEALIAINSMRDLTKEN